MVPRAYWKNVDEMTVSRLELLAPATSSRDHERVEELMQSDTIFSTIRNGEIRGLILRRILVQERLIPSLRTFFEDQKYLEPCSAILKSLLTDDEKRPLWRAFKANYWPTGEIHVQFSEGTSACATLRVHPETDKDIGMKLGYLQLWLFCMRHFPELTDTKPRIESRRKKKVIREYNVTRLQQLGSLAVKLGFKTQKTLALAFEVANWTEEVSTRMMEPRSSISHVLQFASGSHWPTERRCGRPFDSDHDNDQKSLFPFMLYSKIVQGESITPLYVKRNVFEAFLSPFIPAVSLKHPMD
jgi:hypothetical protein